LHETKVADGSLWGVRLVDKRAPPPDPRAREWAEAPERSYNLGLTDRGQRTLEALGVLDAVRRYSAPVLGRQGWAKDGAPKVTLKQGRKYTPQCIQRDRLTSVLLEAAQAHPAISCSHETEVSRVEWEADGPAVTLAEKGVASGPTLRPALLVGADGCNSAVAEAVAAAGEAEVVKFEDNNVRRYKTLPVDFDLHPDPASWRRDLNLSASSADGAGVALEVLPTVEGKGVGVALFRPGNEAIREADTPEKARAMLEVNFPLFKDLFSDRAMASFAEQREQKLPGFSYVANSLHGDRTALLGDAIHCVKPYFGMGVNSAFEDVSVLEGCLEGVDPAGSGRLELNTALEAFSEKHKSNAKALVTMQRSFDGKGPAGFFTFVLPIILDTLFNKLLPSVFSPNGIQMLQRADLTFAEAARIKRRDRALQVGALAAFLAAAARAVPWLARRVLGLWLSGAA
jgi:2-polyprenyl-6-methoxyphenol hydroxylase-like FAD-dependent oxidoreductase